MASVFVGIASSIDIPSDVPIQLSFHLDARALWFTALASVLSAVLFGLTPALQFTRQVAGRTREIGIRMAIGTDWVRVLRMILKQSAAMSVTGAAIGVVLSVGASRAARVDPIEALREE